MRSRQLAQRKTSASKWRRRQSDVTKLFSHLLPRFAPCLVFLVALTAVHAQTSQATVRGNVHDPTNAVIIGARLVLQNVDTHVASSTVTNSAGDYLFQNINPGTYTLEASRSGFSAVKLKPFVLVVNQTASLDIALAVGNVTEVVQVDAVGEGVQASTSELGETLESEQVEDLPLNGRNFTSLFTTVPGVSPNIPGGSQSASYTTAIGPVSIPSFNGQTNRSDLFVVDGILDIETFGDAYAVQPIIDVIQDQKLQAHNDSAEFGGSTGGTINISTKSGTNALHGSAWELNKTGTLQALPYFTPAGSAATKLNQNEFGGTIGGPVVIPRLYHGKNKTFFFGSYEGLRYSSPGSAPEIVPTPAELTGDFSALSTPIYDPATTTCNAAGVCTRQQFSYNGRLNVIPPDRLNQGDIVYAQDTLPAISSTPVAGGNAYENTPTTQNYNEYDARGDETIGQKDSLFFRIMGLRGTSNSGWTRLPNSLVTKSYQWVGSYVHIFSPNSTLHIQIGRTYLNRDQTQYFQGLPSNFSQQVGFTPDLVAPYLTGVSLIPNYSVSGYFGQGESDTPQVTANSKSIKGDYTQVWGKNTFKAGAEFNKLGEGQDIQYAQLSFISNTTSDLGSDISGDALASFLIGAPDNVIRRNSPESLGFGGIFGTYIQDQFQLSPKLTLNLGARWDYGDLPKFGTPHDNNQAVGNFDFSNGTYVIYKQPGPCATVGTAPCIPTADGSLPDHVVLSSDGKQLENTPYNLQPRIGAAYRLTPTMAIRSGIGIAFDEYAAVVQNIRGLAANWPSTGQIQHQSLNSPTTGDPFPDVTPQALPGLSSLPAPTPFQNENWYIDPRLKDAYSIQWNLGIQRQLASTTVATLTYVGSANKRLSHGGLWNVPATPGPGDPTARALYPYITRTFYSKSDGKGDYNALQAQLTRSFSHGLAATVAYTWGKSIDEGCSGFFGSEGCDVQQVYNPHADRSVSSFDVPQDLSFTFNYQLPIGRGKLVNTENRLLDLIAGGWQINGIALFVSGTPYAVHLNADIANLGNSGYERADVVGSSVPANRSASNWLNPAGFATPALYTYGDMGRNSLRAQFYSNFDSSLFKEVRIENRLTFQLRAEAFNLPNEHVLGVPSSTLDGPNFGVIGYTTDGARNLQLGAKIIF